ncbi:MAG TPA: hypothetical protein VER33_03585 [Polyangiaceae bacterium]|nr:hypothetical protein [Polyangiaceae bacterium]
MTARSWLVAATLLIAACGPDARPSVLCTNEPQFVVEIRSSVGALPPDTHITVLYGSGTESYDLAEPSEGEVLFCVGDAGASGEAGAPGESPSRLQCTLWTEGPASLHVKADGFGEERRDLRLDNQLCTVTAEVVLVPLDEN